MVRFDKYGTNREEARVVIAGVERQLKAGFDFTKVAEAGREDVVVDAGADGWIDSGSLASEVLDQALFSLPIDQLSEILEDERGVHLVRVVERNAEAVTPFAEAEPEIRQKIQEERNLDRRIAYEAHLRKTIRVWNLFRESGIDSEVKPPGKADRPPPTVTADQPPAGQTPSSYSKPLPDGWVFPELFQGDARKPQKPAEPSQPADLLNAADRWRGAPAAEAEK